MIEIVFEKDERLEKTVQEAETLTNIDMEIAVHVNDPSKNIDVWFWIYDLLAYSYYEYSLSKLKEIHEGKEFDYNTSELDTENLHLSLKNDTLSICIIYYKEISEGPVEVPFIEYQKALIKATKEFIDYILMKKPSLKNDMYLMRLDKLLKKTEEEGFY